MVVPVLFDLKPKERLEELYDFRDEIDRLMTCYKDGRMTPILDLGHPINDEIFTTALKALVNMYMAI